MSLSGDDIAEVVVPAVDREAASTRKFLAFQHRRTGLDVYRDSTVRVEGGLMCVDVPHRGVIYERRALCALVAENPTAFPEYLPRSSSASRALMCCALTKAGANCTNKYGGNGHTCNVHGAHGVSALLVDNDSRPMSSACMDCSLGAQLSSGAVYRCCTCSRWAHAPTDTPTPILGSRALAGRPDSPSVHRPPPIGLLIFLVGEGDAPPSPYHLLCANASRSPARWDEPLATVPLRSVARRRLVQVHGRRRGRARKPSGTR